MRLVCFAISEINSGFIYKRRSKVSGYLFLQKVMAMMRAEGGELRGAESVSGVGGPVDLANREQSGLEGNQSNDKR